MKWVKCSMHLAFQFSQGKSIRSNILINPPEIGAEGLEFQDGTAIACLSKWDMPLSERAADASPEPPNWWIYS